MGAVAEVTYLEAIRSAMADAMRDDERVFLIGEDVGHFGGPFGVSKGLLEEFGAERVIDTPIAEEGFVGAAFGAAWMGERPIAELQFADFISCAFDSIVTVGAKTHWRSGIKLPVVIRSPFGGGVRGGPFHASCPEGFFIGTAGLKVVCPGSVEDAYGLLRSCDRRRRPGALLRAQGALPPPACRGAATSSLRTPIGRARIAREGSDVTVVAYGAMVDIALRAAADARRRGLRRGARPAHGLAARRATPSSSRSRARRACACCRRRARRSAPRAPCSR